MTFLSLSLYSPSIDNSFLKQFDKVGIDVLTVIADIGPEQREISIPVRQPVFKFFDDSLDWLTLDLAPGKLNRAVRAVPFASRRHPDAEGFAARFFFNFFVEHVPVIFDAILIIEAFNLQLNLLKILIRFR